MSKKVEIWLDETHQRIVHDAIATYTKGPLYCIYCTNGLVYKYPISHLFRTVEEYGSHGGDGIKEQK